MDSIRFQQFRFNPVGRVEETLVKEAFKGLDRFQQFRFNPVGRVKLNHWDVDAIVFPTIPI